MLGHHRRSDPRTAEAADGDARSPSSPVRRVGCCLWSFAPARLRGEHRHWYRRSRTEGTRSDLKHPDEPRSQSCREAVIRPAWMAHRPGIRADPSRGRTRMQQGTRLRTALGAAAVAILAVAMLAPAGASAAGNGHGSRSGPGQRPGSLQWPRPRQRSRSRPGPGQRPRPGRGPRPGQRPRPDQRRWHR